ncbi:MAG: hypothetical protein ACTHKT_02015 [Solirubrobacterales bacterium]
MAILGAVPSIASASPELQTSTGTKVPVETELKGVNVGNWLFTTSAGTMECTKVKLSAKVHQNSGTEVKITITEFNLRGDDPEEEKCTGTIPDLFGSTSTWGMTTKVSLTNHWCWETSTVFPSTEFTLTDAACTLEGKKVPIVIDETTHSGLSLGTCEYERSGVKGTYNLNAAPLEFTLAEKTEFTLVGGTATNCPKSGVMDGRAKLETAAGGALKMV